VGDSPLLFGGAARLLSVQLLDAGANAAVVVLGALVVNARMLLYSASLAPHAAAWPASPTTWASRSRCGPPGR
jgi:predicted branched-subunit amino acid permease